MKCKKHNWVMVSKKFFNGDLCLPEREDHYVYRFVCPDCGKVKVVGLEE